MDWLRQLPIGQFIADSKCWLRYLDPRIKIIWSITFLTSPILSGPIWRSSLVILLLAITCFSGLPWRVWSRNVCGLLIFAFSMGVLTTILSANIPTKNSFSRPPNEIIFESHSKVNKPSIHDKLISINWDLIHWAPPSTFSEKPRNIIITRRSVEIGVYTATLLFTLIHSSNLLLLSTPPEELIWGIAWFLMPLRIVGIPIERIGFTLLLSLRFLPLVQEESQNLLRSLGTRSIRVRRLGLKQSIDLALAVIERLLFNILLRAEQGAEALLVRGGHWVSPKRFKPPMRSSKYTNTISLSVLVTILSLRTKYGIL
uniref:Possible cobalt transport protein n=1 Tax=Paulinella chromatophora TaxID=39717 RepID=B1X3I9_PAUCH|nr:possible cobalt transport protein [Paulinella chromatophora]ACB42508.1 possible cobalt transport protein [Paulinella chromatophora]